MWSPWEERRYQQIPRGKITVTIYSGCAASPIGRGSPSPVQRSLPDLHTRFLTFRPSLPAVWGISNKRIGCSCSEVREDNHRGSSEGRTRWHWVRSPTHIRRTPDSDSKASGQPRFQTSGQIHDV